MVNLPSVPKIARVFGVFLEQLIEIVKEQAIAATLIMLKRALGK